MSAFGNGSGSWIRRFRQGAPEAGRVVCFPHAGGAASFYFPFSRSLSSPAEVLAVQYPGRQDRYRDKLAASITEMADGIVRELAPEAACRPVFYFFGHSMGAVLAFEVIRRLEEKERCQPCLAVRFRSPRPIAATR